MRRTGLAFAAIFVLCLTSAGANGQTTRGTDTTAVTLRRVYQRFLDGVRTRDTVLYRDLLTPDYSYVGEGGIVVRDRSARLKRDIAESDRYDLFEVERCDLSIQSSSAVGPCWYHARGVSNGQHGDWHGVSMLTFVRTTGGWRIAASRPSLLQPK